MPSPPARRNRTLTLTAAEERRYRKRLLTPVAPCTLAEVQNRTLHADVFQVAGLLPPGVVDLLIADPPYNLYKVFNGRPFNPRSHAAYAAWLASWLEPLLPALKPTASVYICGDWRSGAAVQEVMGRHLQVRNRITWEREKGRGAKTNWKNSSEDVWFGTCSGQYTFNVKAVKLRKRVHAPYTDAEGRPKDWQETAHGRTRLTHPSNVWTDLTVPFWSMPENTEHPTQKPEKLLAKLILASSNPGDLVLDPFLGSGTTSVVAHKLGRHYIGIEREARYACLAEKRLALAAANPGIQGYADGVFWARNAAVKAGRRPLDELVDQDADHE